MSEITQPLVAASRELFKFQKELEQRKFVGIEVSALSGIRLQDNPPALIVYALICPKFIEEARRQELKLIRDLELDLLAFDEHKWTKRWFDNKENLTATILLDEAQHHEMIKRSFLRYGQLEVALRG